jgi:hypothetical protein
MTAKDIVENVGLGEFNTATKPGVFKSSSEKHEDRKLLGERLEASQDRYKSGNPLESLHDDIEVNGVKEPLNIYTGKDDKGFRLANGHHRLASQYAHNPDAKIPVRIVEQKDQRKNNG